MNKRISILFYYLGSHRKIHGNVWISRVAQGCVLASLLLLGTVPCWVPYLCGRRSCRPPVCERSGSDPADELLCGCSTDGENGKFSLTQIHTHTPLEPSWDHTWMDPRRSESRFLQTGSRISMQLKLRQAAGARAQDRACWRVQEHFSITHHSGVKTRLHAIRESSQGY